MTRLMAVVTLTLLIGDDHVVSRRSVTTDQPGTVTSTTAPHLRRVQSVCVNACTYVGASQGYAAVIEGLQFMSRCIIHSLTLFVSQNQLGDILCFRKFSGL